MTSRSTVLLIWSLMIQTALEIGSYTHSKFANWKIFLLEEGSFVLVHFWLEESSVEGREESAALFPFALQFIFHQVATLHNT